MYLGDGGSVYIETDHPAYPHVVDFLVSCCEPVSRTHHMQHYRLDAASLSAASAEGTYTCDMMRNILRYFRLDAQRALPIDLQRYVALAQWAASPEADVDAHSYRDLSFVAAAHKKQEQQQQQQQQDDDAVVASMATCATNEAAGDTNDGAGDGGNDAARVHSRRVLRLRTSSNSNNNNDSDGNKAADMVAKDSTSLARQPLVAYAVVRPAAVRALPSGIEAMLREEEAASRMLIILQPRMRRFHDATSSSSSNNSNSAASDAAADNELRYFLVSRDRRQLEAVMPGIREFVQPVLLHGAPRYVISDVDRDAAAAFVAQQQKNAGDGATSQLHEEQPQAQDEDGDGAAADDGAGGVAGGGGGAAAARGTRRPVVLRRLFATPSHNKGGKEDDGNSNGVGARSGLVYKAVLQRGKLRNVKERLYRQYGIRADCHYEFGHDASLHVERLTLRSHTRLRHYQAASLERFCGDGHKAHQGVVVLPCGAGKTLTGIAAAATLRKRTLVLCINNMSVFQWRREFLQWTNLPPSEVTVCTAKVKQMPGSVFITTYNMLISKRNDSSSSSGREAAGVTKGRSARETEAILSAVTQASWGLLLLDEVHTALAHHFQEVLNTVQHKCVLGLSATLLREDDRIADLRHLVGPKLHEANWLELTRQGYLARVECAEVQCPLPRAYATAYAAASTTSLLQQQQQQHRDGSGGGGGGNMDALTHNIAACNPYKLWCTQALLEFHRHRSPPDKVILFCDYLADVQYYAHHLHLPFMDQRTSEQERANLLQHFQHSDEVNAVILTRVGDVALDLPCASVVIQISGLGASRRQEAQRLGRIMRPKPPSLDNTCAYFYTLVSQDTHEVRTSYERQSWLRDQGFGYRVLHGETVLRCAARAGVTRCCVGPPQWWFQVVPSDAGFARALQRQQQQQQQQQTRQAHEHAVMVSYKQAHWAPFSRAASARIQRGFDYGKDECILTPDVLGHDTLQLWCAHATTTTATTTRPSSLSSLTRSQCVPSSWRVRFSSADAPETFGVVHMTDGGDDDGNTVVAAAVAAAAAASTTQRRHHGNSAAAAAAALLMPRRIRFGLLGQPHDCQHCRDATTGATCFDYALTQLRNQAKTMATTTKMSSSSSFAAAAGDDVDTKDDDDEDDDDVVRGNKRSRALALASPTRGRGDATRQRVNNDDGGDAEDDDANAQSLLAYALSST